MFWTEAERAGLKSMGADTKACVAHSVGIRTRAEADGIFTPGSPIVNREWRDKNPIDWILLKAEMHMAEGLIRGAESAIQHYVHAARTTKERTISNRVDVSSLKPWTGRGRIELMYCPLYVRNGRHPACWGFGCSDEYKDTDCYVETQQDRED